MTTPFDMGYDVMRALAMTGCAIFDFDRTIVAIDTGSAFPSAAAVRFGCPWPSPSRRWLVLPIERQ